MSGGLSAHLTPLLPSQGRFEEQVRRWQQQCLESLIGKSV